MTATPDQIPTDLTLEIGEDLSPERFVAVARAFFGYVSEVSEAINPDSHPLPWVVRVREGSTLLAVDPSPGVPPEVISAVYKRAERGIRHLLDSDVEDSGLSESAIRHLRTLAEMTEATSKKAAPTSIRLWVQKKPINLEPTIARTIREETRPDYNDYGTIEGRLEAIQESNRTLQFFIRDALLRQRVRCHFPEDLLPDVFEKFRRRVEVSGVIHYRKNGKPISIEAEQIVELPEDSELPTASDVRGILSN